MGEREISHCLDFPTSHVQLVRLHDKVVLIRKPEIADNEPLKTSAGDVTSRKQTDIFKQAKIHGTKIVKRYNRLLPALGDTAFSKIPRV